MRVQPKPTAVTDDIANVVGNILIFIPLGVYASWLRRRAVAWLTMFTVASVSMAVDIIQGVFAVGASDIDDVIPHSTAPLLRVYPSAGTVLLRR